MAVCRAGADQRADFLKGGVVGLAALELAFAADAVAQLIHRGEGDGRDRALGAGRVHAALWPVGSEASN